MSSNNKPKVYVTRRVPPKGMELLQQHCHVTQWDSDDPVTHDELLHNVPGIDGLFCLLTDKVDSEVIEKAGPSLKVICTMSVGYDHIDLHTCKEKGIKVGNTPKVSTESVQEITVALLLCVARRLFEASAAVKDGSWGPWSPMWMCGHTLENSTVGIVGLGRIGFAVAEGCKPFGPRRFLYADQFANPRAGDIPIEKVDLEYLLKESDFIISMCPLTKETRGLFNKDAFKKMKPNAVFINTGRGGLVNQDDLYQALKAGEIFGAGLDVTDPEPLRPDHPLLTLPNCVITPHIGSATTEVRNTMSDLTARNIMAVLNNEPMPEPVTF